jgi:hypothetical protein
MGAGPLANGIVNIITGITYTMNLPAPISLTVF